MRAGCPGGTTEISRWRQPPEPHAERTRPGGAVERSPVEFQRPCRGGCLFPAIRWLTPPANFRCPSGTTDFAAPHLITPTLHELQTPQHRPRVTFPDVVLAAAPRLSRSDGLAMSRCGFRLSARGTASGYGYTLCASAVNPQPNCIDKAQDDGDLSAARDPSRLTDSAPSPVSRAGAAWARAR